MNDRDTKTKRALDAEEKAEQEIRYLSDQISEHDVLYYQFDSPSISDEEYDLLRARLRDLEMRFPKLKSQDSPSQRVGHLASDSAFKKIKHLKPVFSLDNAFSDEQASAFIEKSARFLNLEKNTPIEWIADPKIDGLAMVLRYVNGELISAATRGNGEEGEDVTKNAKTICDIPNSLINYDGPSEIEIRGEVYIMEADFQKMNADRKKEDLVPFANSRNCASGSLRQLDDTITASRPLRFLGYGFTDIGEKSYEDGMKRLASWGIPVQLSLRCRSVDDVIKSFRYFSSLREKNRIGYAIDGVVYKINNLEWQKRLGSSARAPRFAFAYKFRSEEQITTIEDISVQVGRTGVITPVAHVDPVLVGGVVVRRASLHNEDEISRKDVRIGDKVVLRRAGDVIPKIESVIESMRNSSSKPFNFPNLCPSCGSELFREPSKSAVKCINSFACPAQSIWKIRHFTSKQAFNIAGMGEQTIKTFINFGLIRLVDDIFDLHQKRNQIEQLDGFGKKATTNLLTAIENSREISLDRFIFSLGIPEIGESASKELAKHYLSIDNLVSAACALSSSYDPAITPFSDLTNIDGIGSSTATQLRDFFSFRDNECLVRSLISKVKVAPFSHEKIKNSSQFFGKTIVFTGRLETMSRSEAKSIAEKLGAKVMNSVSSKTDFLIVGKGGGSKLEEAEYMGVQCVSESEWARQSSMLI
ncbi:NAD-dependent DNA ligase LigA [Candidatus Hydrogenosomobacter endosymbioticus]|nr:NAD-dependent DNA ligase LigA [Candidatus Hydrogenosomobacter endosymbioticus]